MQLPDPFISPVEAASITDPFTVGREIVTFQIIGTLVAGEEFLFEVEDPAAVSGWRALVLDSVETKIELGNDQVTFYARAYIRINKTLTTVACGLRVVT